MYSLLLKRTLGCSWATAVFGQNSVKDDIFKLRDGDISYIEHSALDLILGKNFDEAGILTVCRVGGHEWEDDNDKRDCDAEKVTNGKLLRQKTPIVVLSVDCDTREKVFLRHFRFNF